MVYFEFRYRPAIRGSEVFPLWLVSFLKLIPFKSTFFLLDVIHPFGMFRAAWSLAQTTTLLYANLNRWKSSACLLAIFKKIATSGPSFFPIAFPEKVMVTWAFSPCWYISGKCHLSGSFNCLSMKHSSVLLSFCKMFFLFLNLLLFILSLLVCRSLLWFGSFWRIQSCSF